MKKEILLHVVIGVIVLMALAGCARECYTGRTYLPALPFETETIMDQTSTFPTYGLFKMDYFFSEPGYMIDILWYMWIYHPEDYLESIQALFIGPVF